jgi:hypothetical protein
MLTLLAQILNSPGFNSIVVLVGVLIAIRQLKLNQQAIKAQLQSSSEALDAQLNTWQDALNKHLEAVERQMQLSRELTERQVNDAREVAKRRETAKLLLKCRGDEKLQNGYNVIERFYREEGHNIRDLAKPVGPSEKNFNDRRDVMYLLNHFENVAICIGRQIYCEEMIDDAWRTLMIDTRRSAEALITALREAQKNERILIAFTDLVDQKLIPRAKK